VASSTAAWYHHLPQLAEVRPIDIAIELEVGALFPPLAAKH
jgi:hypothetical protein